MVHMDNESLEAGRALAHPAPGEEVVISGNSGIYPDCDTVSEFAEKLFNKSDLITGDGRRWTLDHPEIPQRTGKLNNISKFDAGYFGIHYKQAHAMDPMCRMLLEKAAEAVFDAGYNPQSLYGARIGVFVGACFSETEKTWFYEKLQVNGFGITGCARTMLANRISYWLGVKGPSYTIDTACSSSLYAFEHGYRAIREGLCDAAIVAGTNLCLHPFVSLQFSRLGVLSKDGKCKSFDDGANGYCRSEAISAMFLQKKKDSRRIYATVVHAKTNCDGYKEEGITFPSGPLQQSLLEEFYEECQIDPNSLSWIEAHGTGTKVGDPEEIKAIENVFCVNRKTPLKIGSLKSNLGHTEPASGILSITKAIVAMESGFIPPNINYSTPRKEIDALHNGKIEVVTEKVPWTGGLVGINSFGFGGANCHVLLKWNEKLKVNKGLPRDDLPRLVCASSRTQEGVEYMLSSLEKNLDVELVKLFHSIFKETVPAHLYRGYTLVSKSNKIASASKFSPTLNQPIWYYFPGLGIEWKNGLGNLMKMPLFAQAFNECSNILKKQNFDLMAFLHGKTEEKNISFRNIFTNCIVQLIFANVLKNVSFEADGIIGTSFGEIVCAFVDGALSFEQSVLTAFFMSKAVSLLEAQNGSTVLCGLPFSEIKALCSPDIYFVYKGEKYTIFSGTDKAIKSVIDKTKGTGAFTKVLLGISLHNNQVSSIKASLQQQLQKVITQKRISSPKWLSTSIKDGKNATNFTVSAEYFCNILMNPICLEGWCNDIKRGSSIVEVSPYHTFDMFHSKKIMNEKLSFIPILAENNNDLTSSFFTSLGEIYNCGGNLDLALFYPAIEFPVSRSTPMISPLIKWDHTDDWFVCSYKTQDRITTGERFVGVTLRDEEQEYISGHVVDSRNLYPATGYLVLVWETIALMNAKLYGEVPVVFENVRFNRATNIPKDGGTIDFTVTVQRSSGFFEVMESGAAVVTGKVFIPEDVSREVSGLVDNEDLSPDDEIFVIKPRDFYKELRLRGYNYKGLFKSVTCTNLDATKGFIKWQNNWVAFMDNLLQFQILSTDSRGLFVPTAITRLVIDAVKHNKIVQELDDENRDIPVYNHKYAKLIRAGGIEARGVSASAIARKKPLGEPVLETYSFMPYHPLNQNMTIDAIVRAFVHITLENNPTISVKVYELGELGSHDGYLCHLMVNALANLPLIQPDVTVFQVQSEKLGEDHAPEITTDDKRMPPDQSALVVIGCDLLNPANEHILQACVSSAKETGFIISRDKAHYEVTNNSIVKFSSMTIGDTYYTLLRKVKSGPKKIASIAVSNESFSWIKTLQEKLKSDEFKRVIVYSQNQPMCGVIGLANCLLKESHEERVRCFFILDPKAPTFSVDNPFYSNQIEKDYVINVYKDGNWGSYRHSLLEASANINTPHAYVSFMTKGDVSSLTWTEGHLAREMLNSKKDDVIHIYYSALNFRDVMTSTGKLASEVIEKNRLYQDCVQGLEFSGRTSTGKRIMGMVGQKGIGTIIDPKVTLYWEIPDTWTMEEAATIPCVYGTIVYAFYLVGLPKPGDSILIHAGSGGIGQGAIHFCLFHGCKVFTTVGTPEKREFIKKTFPQIKDNQIGNSRDTSFEQLIMRETNGRGVDFVMNSLAEEKLLASVRCLAKGGRFMELGKFDMANDNPLGVEFLKREASFQGVMLTLCLDMDQKWKHLIHSLVLENLKKGAIRPFNRIVFEREEAENALRFMASGKHMGKVLIKIRDEEPQLILKPKPLIVEAKPRFHCRKEKSYIILGGLGGFGLELTDWLILRRAKNIILSSRSGVKDGYQAYRIKIWESYGVKIHVFTDDVSTEEGVISLLSKSNKVAPVGGIFNLAVVLRDGLFDNQNEKEFKTSFNPKAIATELLDKHTRKMCPELEQFVVFSSVSCGRGNAGQTNYGMSNSIMERVCEARVNDGYPGLAIQWGAVGDVGLVANMQEENSEIVIGGTLPQKIESCLSVMDVFLNEKHPIVASMVVAEKKAGSGGAENMVETVLNILGLRDLKSVSLHSSLAELGMDSMMAVEIKQTLEREFEIFLTPQDIRGMTFAKLQEIASTKSSQSDQKAGENTEKGDGAVLQGLHILVKNIGEEGSASKPIIRMSGNHDLNDISPKYDERVFLLPGIEGFSSVFKTLCANLKEETICVQYDYQATYETIEEMAECVYQRMKNYIDKKHVVRIIGYSFGSIVGLELIKILEGLGYRTNVSIIDGSPEVLKQIAEHGIDTSTDENLEKGIILGFFDLLCPQEKTKYKTPIEEAKDWDARLSILLSVSADNLNYSKDYKRSFVNCIHKRIKAVSKYQGSLQQKLKAPVALIKPGTNLMLGFDEDYGLSKYFASPVRIYVVDGDHLTILDNEKTAEIIQCVKLQE